MTYRFLGLLLSLVASCSFFAQEDSTLNKLDGDTAIYNSLLWEISGNGLEKPCYLYGTMHVSQKLAFHLSDSFYVALQNCDMVALELNPEIWLSQIVEKELNLNAYGGVGYERYNPDFYRNAFTFEQPDNELIANALASDDNLLNSLLYRSSGSSEVEFEEETYLDLYIYQTGKKLGLDIQALEDFDEVNEFRRKASEPSEEDDKRDTRKYLRELTRNGESPRELLENAYREGDLNMVDSLNGLLNPYTNWNKYMLIERNRIMAANMDSLMATRTLFTGVGAAHLPGEDGMIDLLRERGYTLRAMERKIGGKSRKYEQSIDRVEVPVVLSRQTSNDGVFSWEIPGVLYEMPGTNLYREFIQPDMANGAYYWVKRIRTNALLEGRDLDYTRQRLDSLLYENIPGEILSQKDLVQNGWPAVEITNKTRKGDHQRFRVVVTPLELFIFKMGGTLEYAENNSDVVFNSIELNVTQGTNMTRMSPTEGGFEVDMPSGSHFFRYKQGDFPGVEFQGVGSDGDLYHASRRLYYDPGYIEEDEFELRQLALAHTEEDRWDTVSTQYGSFLGYPSLDATFIHTDSTRFLNARYFLKGAEYFCMSRMSDAPEAPEAWWNSFSFKALTSLHEHTLLNDSSLWFNCMSFPELEEARSNSNSGGFMNVDLDEDDVDFSRTFNNRFIQHGDIGEEVFVRCKRHNRFYGVESIDALWEQELIALSEDSLLVVSELDRGRRDSLDYLSVLLTDTNSSRGVYAHLFHHLDRTFAFKTTIDIEIGVSPFFNEIVETFEITADTLEHISIFTDKEELFFEYMASGDSAYIAESFEYLYYLDFKPAHFPRLKAVIDAFPYQAVGVEAKADLIRAIGRTEHADSQQFLRDFYIANQDTSALQLAVLRALALAQTKKDHQLLGELLLENTPVPSDGYQLASLYRPLRDSLELGPLVLESLLALNSIDEYRDRTTDFVERMFDKNVMTRKKGKDMYEPYLLQAKIELKRQRAEEDEDDDDSNYGNDKSMYDEANHDLIEYAGILMPWYEKESSVRELMDGILKTKNPYVHARIYILMAKYGIEVADSTWQKLTENPQTRYGLHVSLNLRDLGHHFPEAYLNRAALSEGKLWYEYNFDQDSSAVVVLKEIYIDARGVDAGWYTFYKGTRTDYRDKEELYLFVVGPYSEDAAGNPMIKHMDVNRLKRIDNEERLDEMMEDAIRDILYAGRKRYRKKSSGGGLGWF